MLEGKTITIQHNKNLNTYLIVCSVIASGAQEPEYDFHIRLKHASGSPADKEFQVHRPPTPRPPAPSRRCGVDATQKKGTLVGDDQGDTQWKQMRDTREKTKKIE